MKIVYCLNMLDSEKGSTSRQQTELEEEFRKRGINFKELDIYGELEENTKTLFSTR